MQLFNNHESWRYFPAICSQDLYLAGRLLPKKGHFQIDADGSSSIHEDGVRLGRVGRVIGGGAECH